MALKINLNLEEIKTFLRVENNLEDDLIQSLQKAAKNEAESFLNTDFHEYDEDGNLIKENEAPEEVKTWILNRIAVLYENRGEVPAPDYSMIRHLRVYPFCGV